MIDIVNFWANQIERFDEQNKCGFCWEFHAPLTNDKANWQQFKEPCCVQAILTDISFSDKPKFNSFGMRTAETECQINFTIRFLMSAEMGTNMYDEIPEHPKDEGLWNKIYFPLLECLGCEPFMDFCESGYRLNVKVDKWDKTLERNYTDENLYGWKINAKINI